MSQLLMEASGLRKRFGERTVVDGIDLTLYAGEVVAVIGPNGAGKSTTLDLILGLRRADSGSIRFWKKDHSRHIGVQLQQTPFFPGLSAIENLKLFAAFYRKPLTKQEGLELLRFCGLQEAAHTEASRLSGGQQKRLSIAAALVHQPELVFLDEPTAALDPVARREIHGLIGKLASSGKSVVFTSHDMEEVHKLATRVAMIRSGRIVAEGAPNRLCETHAVDHLEALYLQMTEFEKKGAVQ